MDKKTRSMGKILLDLECIIDEMCINQELQLGDILALVKAHIEVHNPESIEEYLDKSRPIYYYGPKEGIYGKRKKNRV
jgi:hypothetical protein